MAIGRRDVNFFQILDDLCFPAFADPAILAIHKGGPHLVTAFPANLALEGDIVMDGRVIEAFDVHLI